MVGFSTGSVERALEILEVLVDSPQGLSLTSLADQLEMPKSAAHKLLNTLVGRNYVEQDALTQHYKPTMHLVSQTAGDLPAGSGSSGRRDRRACPDDGGRR